MPCVRAPDGNTRGSCFGASRKFMWLRGFHKCFVILQNSLEFASTIISVSFYKIMAYKMLGNVIRYVYRADLKCCLRIVSAVLKFQCACDYAHNLWFDLFTVGNLFIFCIYLWLSDKPKKCFSSIVLNSFDFRSLNSSSNFFRKLIHWLANVRSHSFSCSCAKVFSQELCSWSDKPYLQALHSHLTIKDSYATRTHFFQK